MTKIVKAHRGYSLFELVATLSVLSVLVLGTIPMAQNAVKRQKEIRLRESLRVMRLAIDEFRRDTFGACVRGAITGNPTVPNTGAVPTDPRSRVVIDDCTIFGIDNLDRYPPSLDTLVSGVKVKPRGMQFQGGMGITPGSPQASDINEDKEIIKVYLREIPIDPITGEREWRIRSSFQDMDSDNWDDINVFDVRSTSDAEALNGEKYSDW